MKKYKIGNRIINADSITSAIRIAKCLDNIKDEQLFYRGAKIYKHPSKNLYMIEGFGESYSSLQEVKSAIDNDIKNGIRFDSVKDNEEIDYLTKEEEQAVEDYRKAIAGTTNPKLLELYKHILDEELEHIRELEQANNNVEDCDMKDWAPEYAIWVKKNGKWLIFGGATSTNIDKRRFLNSGYEDVTVVKNGDEPKINDAESTVTKEEIAKVERLGSKHIRHLGEDVHEFELIKQLSEQDVKKVIPANASCHIKNKRLIVNF